jgi:putative methyltransferase (TIGR04325 family)
MKAVRRFLKDWMPPVGLRLVQKTLGAKNVFEGDYLTWASAAQRCSGYESEHILAKVLDATLKVKRGEAAFERDSVLFAEAEYAWPVLSGLMWAAARNRGSISVLDFGGALGSTYFQNYKFLQTLPNLRWSVVEQAHYVAAGQAHIQDEQLRFYRSIDECLIENVPTVILLSSVLQYLEFPFDVLKTLSKVGANTMIIDRTPFSDSCEEKILVQKVPQSIYRASYPLWVFSRSEFFKKIEVDWQIVTSNLSPEGHIRTASRFEFSFQGMLFEVKKNMFPACA